MNASAAHLLGMGLRHANLPATQDWLDRLAAVRSACTGSGADHALPLHNLPPLPAEQRLPVSAGDLGQFGIPPIYRASIHRIQIHLLELAQEALQQAERAGVKLEREHCDVILVTALGLNRSHENEARAAALRWAAAGWRDHPDARALLELWRQDLEQGFTASSHDKVGEMASALAARVAAHFQLRGRVLALEARAEGGRAALAAALNCLSHGGSRQVLILGAQTLDSPLHERPDLTDTSTPELPTWRESACALLLGDVSAAHAGQMMLQLPPATPVCPRPAATVAAGPVVHIEGQVLPVQTVLGYGHAMQDLQALALAALAQAQAQAQAQTAGAGASRSPAVHAELGPQARLVLQAAGQPLPEQAGSETGPVAVVGCGSAFGDTRGNAEFWAALSQPGHRFRPLDPARHHCDPFLDPQARHSLAYYIEQASHAGLEPALHPHAASMHLARSVASEAWSAVAGLAPERLGRLQVICASNLTTPALRSAGAQALLPRVLERLDALGRLQGWNEALRQSLAHALHNQAQAERLPSAEDQGLATASGLGRAVVGDLPAQVLALEAACASSMAALDLAGLALRAGQVDTVLVLGVELPVNSSDLLLCAAQRMLAPGLMASFGIDASGFTPGDGAGAVLLMRKPQAEALGLPVLAQLLAFGASTDSKSMIAPNQAGQTQAMRRAFAALTTQGIGPSALQYVETHGTGTLIGDQVETASLAEVYAGATQGLALGALKSKFGHCFAAAGMASLIKTVLALAHERMPANHFERPLKPELEWPRLGLDPLFTERPWPRNPQQRRRAGINAFGTGGINYHLVLEEA
ncbi:hypothetical protein C1O66_04390 [Paucibacter aquatile]|uniref:Ketosynthase family 3 (KS3) domain-containing protein n=1 Tax=Kinneretia aquatilis TaxID=2070761 RepID=A0A2N8KTU5_9BURK|nr:polyketide synthase [Paucibacter aquatile]PND36850.1 hypothetical protein C1O66_04390 [Paucibacter aquatile]